MNTLIKKLNYKEEKLVAVLGAPEFFDTVVEEWQLVASIAIDTHLNSRNQYDFVIAFAREKADIAQYAQQLEGHFSGDDPILWIAYPKKSSKKYKSDISRDDGWQVLGNMGFEGVRQVAIDEDWSALRFRRANKIKQLKRDPSWIMSEEGKKRVK